MERVPCQQCGAMVLPTTSEKTGGLCMPCFKKPQKEAANMQHAQDLHDHDLIDAGRRHFERYVGNQNKEEGLEYFKKTYSALLPFLSENELLKNVIDPNEIEDWYNFEMRYSMLTEKGIKLFDKCHMKWLEGHDRGTKLDYIGLWKKELKSL